MWRFERVCSSFLSDGPKHGYGLKSAFERATGGVWPLNVGQVTPRSSGLSGRGLWVRPMWMTGQRACASDRAWPRSPGRLVVGGARRRAATA